MTISARHIRIVPSNVAQILFGVISDGGGAVILPGSGILPLPPRGPELVRISQLTLDNLIGLAIMKMSSHVTHTEPRNSDKNRCKLGK